MLNRDSGRIRQHIQEDRSYNLLSKKTYFGQVWGQASPVQLIIKQGGTDMGDKGSKDKGKKEKQKVAEHTAKEKRKLKKEKKNKKFPMRPGDL